MENSTPENAFEHSLIWLAASQHAHAHFTRVAIRSGNSGHRLQVIITTAHIPTCCLTSWRWWNRTVCRTKTRLTRHACEMQASSGWHGAVWLSLPFGYGHCITMTLQHVTHAIPLRVGGCLGVSRYAIRAYMPGNTTVFWVISFPNQYTYINHPQAVICVHFR